MIIIVVAMQGAPWSWNLGKAWKVMENGDNVMEFLLRYCTEQFCKSDTTSFIKSNYEPFYPFLTVVLRADGTVTTNSGMHS